MTERSDRGYYSFGSIFVAVLYLLILACFLAYIEDEGVSKMLSAIILLLPIGPAVVFLKRKRADTDAGYDRLRGAVVLLLFAMALSIVLYIFLDLFSGAYVVAVMLALLSAFGFGVGSLVSVIGYLDGNRAIESAVPSRIQGLFAPVWESGATMLSFFGVCFLCVGISLGFGVAICDRYYRLQDDVPALAFERLEKKEISEACVDFTRKYADMRVPLLEFDWGSIERLKTNGVSDKAGLGDPEQIATLDSIDVTQQCENWSDDRDGQMRCRLLEAAVGIACPLSRLEMRQRGSVRICAMQPDGKPERYSMLNDLAKGPIRNLVANLLNVRAHDAPQIILAFEPIPSSPGNEAIGLTFLTLPHFDISAGFHFKQRAPELLDYLYFVANSITSTGDGGMYPSRSFVKFLAVVASAYQVVLCVLLTAALVAFYSRKS